MLSSVSGNRQHCRTTNRTRNMVSTWSTVEVSASLTRIGLQKFVQAFVDNEMEGQDILDISEKMIGQLIPPIGKQLLFLREQAILKNSTTPSKLDAKLGARAQSPSEGNSSEEVTCSPMTSMSGEQSSTSPIEFSFSDDEEMPQPHNTNTSDENPSDLWNDLQNYKFPPFSPYVKTILHTKTSPQDYLPRTSNRSAVIRILAADLVKQHKVALSKQGYTNLVNALFSEYPHIGDPKSWRMSLRTKMKNIRMPLNLESVKILKEKFSCPGTGGRKRMAEVADEEKEACKKREKLEIDVEGPEEDEETTLKHIHALTAELRKGLPDLAVIARKMDRTFTFRWKKINDPNISVEDILLDFPALQERNFLAGEAERHGCSKPCRSAYLKLQSSMIELIKYAKLRCKDFRIHNSKYEEDLESFLDEDQRIDCSLRFAVQLLPSLFRENEQYLLVHSHEDIKSPAPILLFQGGEYQLHINGRSILARTTCKFTNALEALFQSYWVFSLEYPRPVAKTLLFLESYIFQNNCKLPASVRTWAEKIGMRA